MSAWTTIAAETSIPAANTPIAGAYSLPPDQNVIEISGQGPVGGGTLYLLRRVVGPTGNYEYRPYAPDKPIVIELNINIKQEVIYRLSADAANTIEKNRDIF